MSAAKSYPPPRSTREAVFDFIVAYKRKHDGNSPNYRQIMDACGISSTSAMSYHLQKLAEAGRIHLTKKTERSIEVPGGGWTFHEEFTESVVDK